MMVVLADPLVASPVFPDPVAPMAARANRRDNWEAWWKNNGNLYLRQRRPLLDRVVSGDVGFSTGRSRTHEDPFQGLINPELLQTELIPELVQQLEEARSSYVTAAADTLARIADDATRDMIYEHLSPLITDERTAVRDRSILALGILGHKEARQDLMDIALDTKRGRHLTASDGTVSKHRRCLAALGLGFLGDSDVAAPMIKESRKTNLMDVRGALLMGAMHAAPDDRATVSALVDRLRQPIEDRRVQTIAATALGQAGGEAARSALSTLIRLLKTRESPGELRISCAVALGALGRVDDDKVVRALMQGTQLADANLKHVSLMGLGRILESADEKQRTPRARQKIVDHLLQEVVQPDQDANRPFAALALGIGLREDPTDSATREEVAAEIRKVFEAETDPFMAGAFAISLGLMKDPEGAAVMAQRLDDSPTDVLARHLAQAIALSHHDAGTKTFLKEVTAEETQFSVRLEMGRALGIQQDVKAIEPLEKMLQETQSEETVAGIAGALGAMRCTEALSPLLELLRDETRPAGSRIRAITALADLAEPGDTSWFAPYTVDSNLFVRNAGIDLILQR